MYEQGIEIPSEHALKKLGITILTAGPHEIEFTVRATRYHPAGAWVFAVAGVLGFLYANPSTSRFLPPSWQPIPTHFFPTPTIVSWMWLAFCALGTRQIAVRSGLTTRIRITRTWLTAIEKIGGTPGHDEDGKAEILTTGFSIPRWHTVAIVEPPVVDLGPTSDGHRRAMPGVRVEHTQGYHDIVTSASPQTATVVLHLLRLGLRLTSPTE